LHKHTLYVYTATSVVVMTTSGILGQKTEVCTTSDKMTLSMHFCHHPGTWKYFRSHWPLSFSLVRTQWGYRQTNQNCSLSILTLSNS